MNAIEGVVVWKQVLVKILIKTIRRTKVTDREQGKHPGKVAVI